MTTLNVRFLSATRSADDAIDYITEDGKILGQRLYNLPKNTSDAARALNADLWRSGRDGTLLHGVLAYADEEFINVPDAFRHLELLLERSGLSRQPTAAAAHVGRPHLHWLSSRLDHRGRLLPISIFDLREINLDICAQYGLLSRPDRSNPLAAAIVNAQTWEGHLSFTLYLRALPWATHVTPDDIERMLRRVRVSVSRTRTGWRFEHTTALGKTYRAKASRVIPPERRALLREIGSFLAGPDPPGSYGALLAERRLILPHIRRGEHYREVEAAQRKSAKGLGYWHRRLSPSPHPQWTESEVPMIAFFPTGDERLDAHVQSLLADAKYRRNLTLNIAQTPTTARIVEGKRIIFGRDPIDVAIRAGIERAEPGNGTFRWFDAARTENCVALEIAGSDRDAQGTWRLDAGVLRFYEDKPVRGKELLTIDNPTTLATYTLAGKDGKTRVFVVGSRAAIQAQASTLLRDTRTNEVAPILNRIPMVDARIEVAPEHTPVASRDAAQATDERNPFDDDPDGDRATTTDDGRNDESPSIISPADEHTLARNDDDEDDGPNTISSAQPGDLDDQTRASQARDASLNRLMVAWRGYLEGLKLNPERIDALIATQRNLTHAYRHSASIIQQTRGFGGDESARLKALRDLSTSSRSADFALVCAMADTGQPILSPGEFVTNGPQEQRKDLRLDEALQALGRGDHALPIGARPMLLPLTLQKIRVRKEENQVVYETLDRDNNNTRFIEREDGYHFSKRQDEISDNGIRAALLLAAQEDHGAVKLTGSRKFREQVANLAVELGITVTNDRNRVKRIDREMATREHARPKERFTDIGAREAYLRDALQINLASIDITNEPTDRRLRLLEVGPIGEQGLSTVLAADETQTLYTSVLPLTEEMRKADVVIDLTFDKDRQHTVTLVDDRKDGQMREEQERIREKVERPR